jgi:hypothetical protein
VNPRVEVKGALDHVSPSALQAFVAESNRIEGIGLVLQREIQAYEAFLQLPELRVAELEQFVLEVAARPLRDRAGLRNGGGR